MKYFLRGCSRLFVACSLAILLTTVAEAGTPPKKPQPPKVAYMAIASVDPTAMTITVEPRNSSATGSKTYKFTAKTKITSEGHDGAVADLKPGMQIRVSAGADPLIAEELTVTSPPADKK